MNRNRRIRSTPRRRAAAFFLLDMLVTLFVVSVLMTIVMQLMGSMLRTSRDIATSERDAAIVDRAVAQLRRDVLVATQPPATGDAQGVSLGNITWTVDGDALVRHLKQENRDERFGPMPTPTAIRADASVVRLQIGGASWSLRPLMLAQAGRTR